MRERECVRERVLVRVRTRRDCERKRVFERVKEGESLRERDRECE